jgi:glc operon protein GlcG
MIETKSLGLEEARKIAETVLEATVNTMPPGRPMVVAVVDPHGDLIYFTRMDGTVALQVNMAINKAYTAARLRRDTVELQKILKEGEDIAWFGDVRHTPIPGGVLIKAKDGSILGAVGTSGRPAMGPMGDEELARIGARSIQT